MAVNGIDAGSCGGLTQYASPYRQPVSSPDCTTVGSFHAAALAAKGKNNGAPGARAAYHPRFGLPLWDSGNWSGDFDEFQPYDDFAISDGCEP